MRIAWSLLLTLRGASARSARRTAEMTNTYLGDRATWTIGWCTASGLSAGIN